MGEMADYALDTIIDNMISDDEDFDPDEIGHIVFIRGVQCKYCGRWPYYWKQTKDGKWRLRTRTGKIHKCAKYREAKGGDAK